MPKLLHGATFFLPQQERRYVLPKFAMGSPNSLLELKGRSGLDQGPSPLSVALAITRQSRRNVRDDRAVEALDSAAPSHAAQSTKEFVWQRQQRVLTSSSRDQNEHREHGLNTVAKSDSLLPSVHNATSPPLAPSQPAWRHLGSRTEAQKYISPIFTGCPSKDTRLVEIQQTAAAAHVQLMSYSKQLKEAVRLRAIMLEQQRLQMRLRSLQQRVKFSSPPHQGHSTQDTTFE